jgi:hypothetical protein
LSDQLSLSPTFLFSFPMSDTSTVLAQLAELNADYDIENVLSLLIRLEEVRIQVLSTGTAYETARITRLRAEGRHRSHKTPIVLHEETRPRPDKPSVSPVLSPRRTRRLPDQKADIET